MSELCLALLMRCFCFYLQHVNHPGVVNLEEMFETPERVSSERFSLAGYFERKTFSPRLLTPIMSSQCSLNFSK